MALAKDRRVRAVGAFVRETAVIAVLYGLWQLPASCRSPAPPTR